MNTQKRIERCLKAAPKPPAQDGLLDKLQKDVALGEIKTRRSALRRWFVPTGGRISLWRVAAAAIIAIAILLPLSYGAAKSGYKLIEFIIVGENAGPEGEPVNYVARVVLEVEEDFEIEDYEIGEAINILKRKENQETDGNEPAKDEDNQ